MSSRSILLDNYLSAQVYSVPLNVLRAGKKVALLNALVEGNSIMSTERMTGVHRDTIMRLMVRVGEGCARLHDAGVPESTLNGFR